MQAVWIEIPVKDLDRALQFYQAVFGLQEAEIAADDVRRTTVLASTTPEGGAGISLNQTHNFEPSDKGTLVYFDAPKTSMGEAGYYATILDTEGNQLALYSYK